MLRTMSFLSLGSLVFAPSVHGGESLVPHQSRTAESLIPRSINYFPDLEYCKITSKRSLCLDLAAPKKGGPFPAVLVLHGGGWAVGNRKDRLAEIFMLAERGYVAVTASYRFSQEAPFPAALQDARCAIRWLRANAAKYCIDGQHIGVYGFSSGAHLANLLGTAQNRKEWEGLGGHENESSAVQAVASSSGISDLTALHAFAQQKTSVLERMQGTMLVQQFLAGSPSQVPSRYRDASPLTHVSKNAAPTLLLHGEADPTVPLEQSRLLAEKLRAVQVEVHLVVIEKAKHTFNAAARRTAEMHVVQFLDRHLKQPEKRARGTMR